MARRSFVRVVGVIENMSAFTCDHGEHYELFGGGGGQALADAIEAPLLGQIPLEPAVARGGDEGRPVALVDGPAASEFAAIAARLDEVVPPHGTAEVDMSGCTARLLTAVSVALDGS
jgi:ATP-binding protein involved in chromosome partitioning